MPADFQGPPATFFPLFSHNLGAGTTVAARQQVNLGWSLKFS